MHERYADKQVTPKARHNKITGIAKCHTRKQKLFKTDDDDVMIYNYDARFVPAGQDYELYI